MKKMNLKFFGQGAKMVLPLFLLIGLFMFSATRASAQYLDPGSARDAVEQHMSTLKPVMASFAPDQMSQLMKQKVELNNFRHSYGRALLMFISQGETVESAVVKTGDLFLNPPGNHPAVKQSVYDAVKLEFEGLVKD
jgi:hypothetical protein